MPSACMRASAGSNASPVLERGQDVIGRAVDDPAEAEHRHGRQRLAHQIEDRYAVHHRAFEQERQPARAAPARSASIGKGRWSLVRGHDMAAGASAAST